MSVQVTIKDGVHDIVLPNGNRYQAGDTVLLTDEEYGQMSVEGIQAVFSDVVPFDPATEIPGDPQPPV